MTITLQTVNDLIASLESAGELSIKETKVMALAKAFKQLAAENVALEKARKRIIELEQGHCGGALMERELAHSEVTKKLISEIDNRDSRIAELESRTVKLPHRNLGHDKLFLLCPFPYYDAEDMEKALAAAGIKVEAE
ncbi:TPA: hypothetical protein MD920_002867 [Klebsiella pneumoniae]|nr:hypothetical protein [Klebsiella pneumoniae]